LKILFVAPRFSGGIGGHAAMLADKLREHGFEVELLDVAKIPIKNLKNPSFVITSTISGLFKGGFDIVHAFNVPSAFAMKSVRAKKKVLSVHGIFSDQVNALHSSGLGKVAQITEERVLQWADALTTDSMASQRAYKEKLNLEFTYMPSPIDIKKFEQVEDAQKQDQIIYIGRDSYEKGIDILRKAESKINAKTVYCTDKPWKETMRLLKSSKVLVVPSRMESLPTVIKEAFYLGVPVIATNVGGIPELVADKSTGVLIPPENPSHLAEEVNRLLTDKEHAQRLANNAYDFVTKNMTWEVMLPKYVGFYEKLLSGASK